MSSTHVIPFNRQVVIERTMHVIECAACSIVFGIGADFMAKRRKDSASFYCPNGHSNHYPAGKTDEQKLREAQAREIAMRDQLAAAVRDAEATRGALLRDRQRFANGVCPCCNRSFENVRRHMRGQHPDYDITKVEVPMFGCSCGRKFETLHGLHIHQSRQRRDGWDLPANEWRSHLTKVDA